MAGARRLSPDRYVEHECDVRFERPVFGELSGNRDLTACIHCGGVTFTEAEIDEPHPNDVRHYGNDVVVLDTDVRAWVAAWPRRIRGRRYARWIFVDAHARATTLDDLEALEASAERERSSLSRRDALVRGGVPEQAAPATLPRALSPLRELHEAVWFAARDDARGLLELFTRGWWTFDVYCDRLHSMSDLSAAVDEALAGEHDLQTSALRVVDHCRLVTPRVLAYLDHALRTLTPDTKQPYALVQLASRLSAQELIGALEEAARNNPPDRHYYFHQDLTRALAQVRASARAR